MWPYFCIGSGALNNNTKSISAPVFGFENCTCTELWDGNTCHGCARAASAGFQQIPSVGGYASRVFGGSDASGGDYGGMGMICVSWN
jgi:hypothetical protein